MDCKQLVMDKLLFIEGYLRAVHAEADGACDDSSMELHMDNLIETVWRLRFAIRDNDFNQHFPNDREY